jgi:hypothetical protein
MRHVWSILLALVLAPTGWLLCGSGEAGDLIGRAGGAEGFHALTGLALLLSAGSAYGILVLLPISPAGPTLAGLGYLGAGLWALADPTSYAGVWPSADVARPGYGLALVLAVPLLGTALVMRRWEQPEAERLWPVRMPEMDRPAADRPSSERSSFDRSSFDRPSGDQLSGDQLSIDGLLGGEDDEATTMFAVLPVEMTGPLQPIRVDDEVTTVIRLPGNGASEPGMEGDEATGVMVGEDAEATSLLVPLPVRGASGGGDAEETTLLGTADASGVESDKSDTVALSAEAGEASADAPPMAGDEPVAHDEPAAQGQSAAHDGPATQDHPGPHDQSAAHDGPATGDEPGSVGGLANLEESATVALPAAGAVGDEVAESVTADLGGGRPSGDLSVPDARAAGELGSAGPANGDGPSEKTQVISRNPGETTQVIRSNDGIYPALGETTRSIEPVLGETRRSIAPTPAQAATAGEAAPIDDATAGGPLLGEAAPGVEPAPARDESPEERTQLIKFPAVGLDPVGASSIVEAERPDPGADPTTRIVPLSESGAEPETEPAAAVRSMTVMSMERPPDETDDETRALPLPTQRRPQDD